MRGFVPRWGPSRKVRRAIIGIAIGFLVICAARTPAEDNRPALRIESGMHTAVVNGVSSDAVGRLALTVSKDKTARMWEVSTGRLIRVLRVRVGDGHEGELYGGALSPDGRLAAVGGWTTPTGGSEAIYLLDPATGGLVRRIGGLPDIVYGLAFSADGRYLAAVFGSGGLRVWECVTGREVGRDSKYGDLSFGVDWRETIGWSPRATMDTCAFIRSKTVEPVHN
jgi:WD40 repeat protein